MTIAPEHPATLPAGVAFPAPRTAPWELAQKGPTSANIVNIARPTLAQP